MKTAFDAQSLPLRRDVRLWSLLAGIAAASAYSGESRAQEPEARAILEEITVTSRRVSESLQTTGASVAAFTVEKLDALNIMNAQDIAKYTPNLEFKTRSGSASQGLAIKIRGIGVSDVDYLAGDPSVAVYIDGIFQARAFGPQFELFDVERIEVLRGPQGTLYGKNSLGGAVNIITKKPDGEDSAAGDVTFGNYGRLNYSARASTTLVEDKVFGSLAITSRNRDGYYNNSVRRGLDPADEALVAARSAVRWLASEAVTVDFAGDYTRQRQHAQGFFLAATGPGLARQAIAAAGYNLNDIVVGMTPSTDRLENASLDYSDGVGAFLPPGRGANGISADNAEFKGAGLTVSVDLAPDTTLRSFSSYRQFNRFLSHDLDGTPASVTDQVKSDDGNQLTQELQLNTQLFGDRLDLVVGAFFLQEDMFEDQSNGFVLGLADAVPALRGISPRQLRDYKNESLAGFTHGIYNVTDSFRLSAGIRYSWEKKRFRYRAGQLQRENIFDQLDETQEQTFNSVTPKFGAEYEFTPDLFTYATVARGYSSGGFSPRVNAALNHIESYDPESLWSYEVGIKSTWFERTLRFNLAAFRMEYDNVVVQSFGAASNSSAIGFFVSNAGAATVQGVEAELEWHPIESFTLSGGVGYLDQKFNRFGVGANGQPIDPKSAHFFDAPDTTANVVAEYALPVAKTAGTFSIGADWSYRGRNYFDNANTAVSSQDPYSLYGARLKYTSPNERLSVQLFGENLTNEVYALRTLNLLASAFGSASVLFGAPRTYGVQLEYKLF